MNPVVKKILLITTIGCLGCDVQNRNIDEAIKQFKLKYKLSKEVKDWRKVDRSLLKQINVKDFPTTVFLVNDKIRFKCVGSYPTAVIVRWIDLYMK